MWDGITYESEKDTQDAKKTFEAECFEVERVEEEGKPLLFTRRVVTEIVVEGEPPA